MDFFIAFWLLIVAFLIWQAIDSMGRRIIRTRILMDADRKRAQEKLTRSICMMSEKKMAKPIDELTKL